MSDEPNRKIRDRRASTLDWGWLALVAVVALWIAHRLGGFDLWTSVSLPEGGAARVVDTFAAVDHPFHASRAELLRRALLDGELLRWVSAHQGGYPVEFYPLGAPAFEVGVWLLTLGQLPMMAVHKIAVIAIFLLPAAGFLLLARADRLPLGVGLLALIFHLCARGWWWSGGYMELVDWGLVSSSLAMALLVLLLPTSYLALDWRSVRWGAVAAIVAACAIYTNVRSLLPMLAIAAGLVLARLLAADRRTDARPRVLLALGIAALTGLLAAPLLIALARFSDLYFFVTYERYENLREYWDASITAVSGPVFVLALVGIVAAVLLPELRAGRFVALTLLSYVVLTILLSGLTIGPSIEQLEATRLMPFQRGLTLYLAALGVYALLSLAARLAARYRVEIVNSGLLAAIVLTLVFYVFWTGSPIPQSDRSLYPVLTTGQSAIAGQQQAIELADQQADPGTALLVLGTAISWHDQFWSMEWSDRPFFFDDWLWYWQKDLDGEYDPAREHVYPDPASTLDAAFLANQGIGAVVVTGRAAQAAAFDPYLEQIAQGPTYAVYLVRDPTPIVTANGVAPTAIEVGNQQIEAAFGQPSDTFDIRRNWFPRWTAAVDGQPATVTKGDNGFMVVTSATPGTRVELSYGVDAWDWLGRLLLLAGIAIAVAALLQPRRFDRFLVPSQTPGLESQISD